MKHLTLLNPSLWSYFTSTLEETRFRTECNKKNHVISDRSLWAPPRSIWATKKMSWASYTYLCPNKICYIWHGRLWLAFFSSDSHFPVAKQTFNGTWFWWENYSGCSQIAYSAIGIVTSLIWVWNNIFTCKFWYFVRSMYTFMREQAIAYSEFVKTGS